MLNLRIQALVLAILPLTFGSFLDLENQGFTRPSQKSVLLSQREMSLENRYQNSFVNGVFKNNILLNLAYLEGKVTSAANIKWEEISKPFHFDFTLNPKKTFAYHEDVKDGYRDRVEKTTNTHFNAYEGFKTDGYLFGDGVCHLASLINWVAKEAGLLVEAPTNHNFANIPDISKEYGVSIYYMPGAKSRNALQNLYITNNQDKPVSFVFHYQDNKVTVSVVKLN